MKQKLKTYKLTLKTVGPVHVGSGKEISKKEYIFLGKDKVAVLDIAKVYEMFKKIKKDGLFENYLLGSTREDMSTWLEKNGIALEKLKPFIKYTLNNSDTFLNHKDKGKLQIMEIMKDPYGKPYIPGSSLKGMLRTILLGWDITQNEEKYAEDKADIVSEAFSKSGGNNRNSILKKNITNIEGKSFCTLQREGTKPGDAVNDYLQGLIVSDSEPLDIEDLTLCQRIELYTDGRKNKLPLLRECIKPGTEIHFTVTIDTSICNLTEQDIMAAVKNFITISFRCFSKSFIASLDKLDEKDKLDKPRVNQVYLGGGAGFVSKTVVYPMFGKEEGLKVTQAVFKKKGVPEVHKHKLDKDYGVSPHILKCTEYKGKLLQMGLCDLKIQEIC